jgi:hypothetical protein
MGAFCVVVIYRASCGVQIGFEVQMDVEIHRCLVKTGIFYVLYTRAAGHRRPEMASKSLKSLFVGGVLISSVLLSGCGTVVETVKNESYRTLINAKAAEEKYPEWMLPAADGKTCPDGYVLEKSGNTMLCHNKEGNGNNPAD